MWRSVFIAAIVYAYGHPHFDGYRPAVIDKPLQSFYSEVNIAAREGQRALVVLDEARTMQYLQGLTDRLAAQLDSANP